MSFKFIPQGAHLKENIIRLPFDEEIVVEVSGDREVEVRYDGSLVPFSINGHWYERDALKDLRDIIDALLEFDTEHRR